MEFSSGRSSAIFSRCDEERDIGGLGYDNGVDCNDRKFLIYLFDSSSSQYFGIASGHGLFSYLSRLP